MFWLDGKVIKDERPVAHAMDRGLLLGDGLFETIRIKAGNPVFLVEHLCRLQISASEIGLPVSRQTIRDGINELLDAQPAMPFGSMRVTLSRGPGPRGMSPIPPADQRPMMLITASPAPPPVAPSEADRLTPAPFIRSSGAISSRMKTLSYMDNLMAKAHAENTGAADVVFVNERGDVACTSMANIFVETEDGFVTPPLTAGILPGIVRAMLLRMAPRHGIKMAVQRLRQSDLWGRRIYRTNSLMGVRPAWYDYGAHARPIALDGAPCPLAQLYEAAEQDDPIR